MAITELAIFVFKSPPSFMDPTIQSLFRKLSVWQSECSGFSLVFFMNLGDPFQIHLVTGWNSVEAHGAWVEGERNQELLRAFAPYVDMPKMSMVHLDMDFEAIPRDAGRVVVERYHGEGPLEPERTRSTWSLLGRDLADAGGDVYRVASGSGESEQGGTLVARWMLDRVAL